MNFTEESTTYFFESASDPEVERGADVIMDLCDVFDGHYSEWPKEVRKICKKRGKLTKLTIKDLLKIEQILGYNILKIGR